MIVYTTNSYVTIQFSVHYRKNIAFHMELPQTDDGLQEGTKPLWSFLTVIKWPWRINAKKILDVEGYINASNLNLNRSNMAYQK